MLFRSGATTTGVAGHCAAAWGTTMKADSDLLVMVWKEVQAISQRLDRIEAELAYRTDMRQVRTDNIIKVLAEKVGKETGL